MNETKNKRGIGKITIIILIALIIAIIAIVFIVISNKSNSHILYSSNEDALILEKINNTSKEINMPDGKVLITTDSNDSVVEVSEKEQNNFTMQNNNNYYYFSLLEHFVNVESSIKESGTYYDYSFKIKFKVLDPLKAISKIPLENSLNVTDFFKIFFDDILKTNLNTLINNYIKENNISIEKLKSSNIENYLLEKINKEIENNYYGVDLNRIYITSITKNT